MSPRKLTAADKKAIVSTYRSSAESTTALADRYGVSNSTISRLLKINIPEDEYESLISEKRSHRSENEEDTLVDLPISADDETISEETIEDLPLDIIPKLKITAGSNRRVRRRSSAAEDEESPEQNIKSSALKPITRAQKYSTTAVTPEEIDLPLTDELLELDQYNEPLPMPLPMVSSVPMPVLNRMPDASITQQQPLPPEEDIEQDLSLVASIFGEDMSDLLDEEEDEADEDGWSEVALPTTLMTPEMQVLPFAAATLPRTCYIVVDKFAELVACPLRDFVELGKASDEAPQNTLPVFDSQRVAKRFSNNRNQRVIKVPDSSVFYKTIDHLLAKGISLMLVDGQIYSLR